MIRLLTYCRHQHSLRLCERVDEIALSYNVAVLHLVNLVSVQEMGCVLVLQVGLFSGSSTF